MKSPESLMTARHCWKILRRLITTLVLMAVTFCFFGSAAAISPEDIAASSSARIYMYENPWTVIYENIEDGFTEAFVRSEHIAYMKVEDNDFTFGLVPYLDLDKFDTSAEDEPIGSVHVVIDIYRRDFLVATMLVTGTRIHLKGTPYSRATTCADMDRFRVKYFNQEYENEWQRWVQACERAKRAD